MPMYTFTCSVCGCFDAPYKMKDVPDVTKCPQCGADANLQIAAPAFHLKGTGWYATDYKRK